MGVPVIAVPGGVLPAAQRYAPLAAALSGEVELHTKDLEVYAGAVPPTDYSIALEVEALARYADDLGLAAFHLAGYSGGGFVSLAFAGAHPDRLLSLALFEPADVPGEPSREETALRKRLQARLSGLDPADFMDLFVRLQVRPGVQVPAPSAPMPEWMRNRPAGLAAMMAAFRAHPFDREQLRAWRFPVFLGYGELTAVQEEVKAGLLGRAIGDIHIRRFPHVHHFVPPEQLYTPDHVDALRELWRRAEAMRVTA
jgi:pimeloyl-ACP methyl ester carboxylesterase